MIQVIMRTLSSATVIAFSFLSPVMMFAQNAPSVAASVNSVALSISDVTVGQHLEALAKVTLNRPLPADGLEITVKSGDPNLLLLSTDPETAGSESIVLKVRAGYTESSEFYAQGLEKRGTVTYTATAPGFGSSTGTATLAASGIVIAGPIGFGAPSFQTSMRGAKVNLKIYSALLDSSLNFVAFQAVGGSAVDVTVTSSSSPVGGVSDLPLTLRPGTNSVTAIFKPASLGQTVLAVNTPSKFSVPAKLASVIAKVELPGFAVTDGVTLGKDLETGATVGLGQAAPPEGVDVTVSSSDPKKLLVSLSAKEKGSASITMKVTGGNMGGSIYLQALDDTGRVNYTASAQGYQSRAGLVVLTQSGVVIAGPLSFPHSGWRREPGFFTSLALKTKTPIYVYSAYLDPETHRAADVTVQPLRAGVSITATITNSNPAAGTTATQIVVGGGTDTGNSEFTPLGVGETMLTIVTPPGFSTPANSTLLHVRVMP